MMAKNGLTYRERFARTIAHLNVDRPPMELGSSDLTEIEGQPQRLASELGISELMTPAETNEAVLRALDTDIRGVGGILTPANDLARQISPTETIDAWGIRYQWNGHHYEAVGRPLSEATIDDLERYPWPDPERIDRDQIAEIKERARFLYDETDYVVCARHPFFGVFELGCWMCGFDDFLYRMAGEPDFVHRFFEIILEYQKRVMDIYYDAVGRYIHFTTSGDDFGTQTGPMISPRMFSTLIAPYLSERIQYTHRYTDAPFFHHTCGSVYALIPELIRSGVEILNPIQPRTKDMEPERLKRDFGSQLTFCGGVDTQILLPTGSPEEVYQSTRDLIRVLGREGGYILSAAHCLQSDVPNENIVAMFRAGRDSAL
jgi:uroporphyrinogen decarboxylase